MKSLGAIITENLKQWQEAHGMTQRNAATEAAEHNAQKREERLARVRRMGGTPPTNAIDVRFRAGVDGRGGRVCWEWTFAPSPIPAT